MRALNSISDIVAEGYLTEDFLLPLLSVESEADKAKYSSQGYMPGYTVSEWKVAFSHINPKYIYYRDGLNVGTCFYDKEHCVYLDLAMYGRKILFPCTDGNYEDAIIKLLHHQYQKFKDKDYVSLLLSMPDGIKMGAFRHLMRHEHSSLFYRVFIAEYVASDFFTASLPSNLPDFLLDCKSEEQKKQTEEALQHLFGDSDEITVYRGAANKSTPYDQALSWTYDLNVANFFATRLGDHARIYKGQVSRKNIIECLSERSEKELLIFPGTVRLEQELSLLGITSQEIEEYVQMFLPLYKAYREELRSLYGMFNTGTCGNHDALHTLRVLFLAGIIGLEESLSSIELEMLCDAAIYHDIGRTNDSVDPQHGKSSALIYRDHCDSYHKVVDFAISMHCISDKKAMREMKREFAPEDQSLAWQILSILKDADALDRVRFGVSYTDNTDGLRISELRYEFSRRLTPLAKQVLRYLTF